MVAPAARTRLAFALAVTAVLVGALVLAAGVLAALPALLAFVPLLAGRYVGAARLERLIEARSPARRRHALAVPEPSRPRPRAELARGARLIACSLAKRPPPALPAAA